jgi:hypothetical protein
VDGVLVVLPLLQAKRRRDEAMRAARVEVRTFIGILSIGPGDSPVSKCFGDLGGFVRGGHQGDLKIVGGARIPGDM